MQADFYKIRQERFRQGLTQADLACKAQISLSTVIKAEGGKSIGAKSHGRILKALGLI